MTSNRDKTARPPRRWVRPVVTTGVLATAVAALAVVAALPGKKEETPPKHVPPVNVEVRRIEPIASLPETFRLPAQVAPHRVVNVSAEVAGRIEHITCREGRPCRSGELLMTLNTDLLAAEYRRAKATAEFDQREQARLKDLLARGAATPTEADQARARAEASSAAMALAKANLDRAEISAPASGVLNRVPVEEGEYLQVGHKVAEIVQNEQVKIVVDVPERYSRQVHLGDEHEVMLGMSEHVFDRGKVTYVAELADPVARTTRVELTVNNRGPGADLIVPNGLDPPRQGHAETVILVTARRAGMKADAVRRDVTVPLAAALRKVPGVSDVRTGAEDGRGLISAAFQKESSEAALSAVRQALARAGRPGDTAEVFTLARYWELARRGLRAGQIVEVRLTLRRIPNAILIPLKAVIPLAETKAVYVVEDGRAERREVELGFFQGWDVLIRSGLKPGDLLITNGHHFVGPGQKVKIVGGLDAPTTAPATAPATGPAASAASAPAGVPGDALLPVPPKRSGGRP